MVSDAESTKQKLIRKSSKKKVIQQREVVPTSSEKSLVVWGTNLQSTVGEKFTRKELAMVRLAPYNKGVIGGLILYDGWLIIYNSKNARFGFKQSLSHSAYVWSVFNTLSHYCNSGIRLTRGIRAGNPFYGLQFLTRLMPCNTELHSLFYRNGVKVIPENIYDLLTPVALAPCSLFFSL